MQPQTDNNNTQVLPEIEAKEYRGEFYLRRTSFDINGTDVAQMTTNLPVEQQKQFAELICKAVNNYSKLVEENERLKTQLNNTHKRVYAFLNEHDGLSDSDYEILRDIKRGECS